MKAKNSRLAGFARAGMAPAVDAAMEALEGRVLLGGDPFPSLSLLEHPDNPVVRMSTERGDIFIELLANEAPNTVANFLEFLDNPNVGQTFFHELIPGVSLQGGTWFFLEDENNDYTSTDSLNAAIPMIHDMNEAGRANTERTIAAYFFPDPNFPVQYSAPMVFNLADNSSVHPTSQYVVFARVLDDNSWDVVQDIASLPTGNFGTAPNVYPGIQVYLPNVPLDEAYTSGDPANPGVVVQVPDMTLVRQSGAPDYYRYATYSAEGFTGATISEFIPIVNPNNDEVYYEVRVRYERGVGQDTTRDDLVFRGSIAANSRGGVTISTPDTWDAALALANRPYAIEVVSTLIVSANLSHYDFGIATGESFVSIFDTDWFFGDVQKNSGFTNDFILWYNNNPVSADVTLTFIRGSDNFSTTITFRTEAFRRGGMNIDTTGVLTEGVYSVIVESTVPILASFTHYDDAEEIPVRDGYASIGQQGEASHVGVIPIAAHAGSDPVTSDFNFAAYNPNGAAADITIDFFVPGATLPMFTSTLTVAAGETGRLTRQLLSEETFIAVYRSTLAVHSSYSFIRNEDSYSTPVGTHAGADFHFAEGFTDPARTSSHELEETLTIFNPFGTVFDLATEDASITLTFRYADGHTFSINRTVEGGTGLNINISELQEVIDQAVLNNRYFYSIEVSSDLPVIAQLMHTDISLGLISHAGGGFSSLGASLGTLDRLEDVINPV